MIGITNNSDAYRSDLRNGVSWGVNYYYLGDKYIFDCLNCLPVSFIRVDSKKQS